MRNALTFDVEEYFQAQAFARVVGVEDWPRLESRVEEGTLRLLEILDRHEVHATFFVVGWVAARRGSLLREIAERGHEVACHSHTHRMIGGLDPDLFRIDVQRAKRTIEDAVGHAVVGYRAPTFSVVRTTLWALDILAEEGFHYDSSIFPIHHHRYGIPHAHRFPHRVELRGGGEILEFPITTVRVAGHHLPLCGGGYFRLMPYPAIRAGIRHVIGSERQPAIVYLHSWEVDPEQPSLPAPFLTRLRHRVNLASTAAKLERLLADFAFAPARQVLREQGFATVSP
jgi:polysaccharide deacetylase family protein (PEP-CTERM system associated)